MKSKENEVNEVGDISVNLHTTQKICPIPVSEEQICLISETLADLDTNNDGLFNSSDAEWNNVKIWKDANGNGIVDEGELLTLEQVGVAGINVDYKPSTTVDDNGNEHKQTGTFIKTDGSTASIHDVWFEIAA